MEITNEKSQAPDLQKVEAFAGQVVSDLAAGMSGVMIQIGHELGLYKAMVGQGPMTAATLARKTNTFERYVQEWINNQAAGGYIDYDPEQRTYELSPEQAMVLAIEDSPAFMTPGFYLVSSFWYDKDKIAKDFREGRGIGWHEHHHNLFYGTEALFKPGYKVNLVNEWIPALEGIDEKLQKGGRAADIGCGHGASTIIMAEKYPNAEFFGFDYHKSSIEVARERAKTAGVKNVHFEVAAADDFQGGTFDLICFMDAFHDLGNPYKAISHARRKLDKEGSILIVEPAASDKVEENFHPVGRMFYAASTAVCVPNSHAQEGDYCMGAQAGPAQVEAIIREAGYTRFRIAQQSPVNLIFEAKH